jgi:hypothetical protein
MKAFTPFLAVLAFATGCATSDPARQPRSELEDIPIPTALSYVEGDSVIIDAPGAKVARLLFRGRVSMTALASVMRSNLEGNGWRKVGSTVLTNQGTTQVYEKERSSLQVRLWENPLFTHMELTTSRLYPPEAGSSAGIPSAVPAGPVTTPTTDPTK